MERDDAGTLASLREIRERIVDPGVTKYAGNVVRIVGDGMLLEFGSADAALRYAIDVQRAMAQRNAPLKIDERIQFRMGINIGDIIVEGDDIAGDGVNVAGRLEGLAEPGGICVSAAVREQVHGALDVSFDDIGQQQVKNITRPIQVYRLGLTSATGKMAPTLPRPDNALRSAAGDAVEVTDENTGEGASIQKRLTLVSKIHFAIIDDHPFVLDALTVIISSMEQRPSVRGFESLREFEDSVASGASFDLALLDLGIPGFAHLESLRHFRVIAPVTPVVVISASDDRATILEALDLGAMGFIPKTSRRDLLMRALELVLAGGIYIPPQALEKPSALASSKPQAEHSHHVHEQSHPAAITSSLSPRQRDVLNLLIKGMPNKLICRELSLSPNTVKSHVGAIFRALNATNRTQAVIAAQRSGFRVDYPRSSSS